MKQVAVTVKIDDELKADIQKLAKNMGLSFSAIVENKLREVRRERRVEFEEELILNTRTVKQLLQAEKDWKAGRNISGSFTSIEELKAHLNSLGHAD